MPNARFISRLLASGGDRRIKVPTGENTNQYGASPFPRSTLGYGSSTANDISQPAYDHLCEMVEAWPAGSLGDSDFYASELEQLRHRLRRAWDVSDAIDIVFAPSGTDLEYIALALTGSPVTNILVGADEVGSGCILSADGRYFAQETAVLAQVRKGAALEGLEGTRIHDIPVRDAEGSACSGDEIASAIDAIAKRESAEGRNCLAHVVYGSKTGLLLPDLDNLDRLRRDNPQLRFVVDACQARLSGSDINALLERECLVLLTGSKFIGGPPFSGMALVPQSWRPTFPLPQGLANVFRRGEWPCEWSACDALPVGANAGLLLRLSAAIFELERFLALDPVAVQNVIDNFGVEVMALTRRLGAKLVEPCMRSGALYQSTLATLDLSSLPAQPDLAMAQRWHRILAARGLRLGQPVKCVRHPGGGWSGTLRISLSMPLIGSFARLDDRALKARIGSDMDRIAHVIEAAQRPVVA